MSIMKSDRVNRLKLSRKGLTELSSEVRAGVDSKSVTAASSWASVTILPSEISKPLESEPITKTRGEIEAGICFEINRFQQEYIGRGPRNVRAHLIGDLLVVRLVGVLTLAERQLANAPEAAKGRELVRQMRTQLIESARPAMRSIIKNVTGVEMISVHHDLSTVVDEEVIVFTLVDCPRFRETIRKEK